MKEEQIEQDNIEMMTISKGPAYIVDKRMKRITENIALTLIYNFEIFHLA